MGEIYAASAQVLASLSTEHSICGGIEWLHDIPPALLDANQHSSPSALYPQNPDLKLLDDHWDNEDFQVGWNAFIRIFWISSWWS